MQFNAQYIKKVILAQMGKTLDLAYEPRKILPEYVSNPKASPQGVPHEIDAVFLSSELALVTAPVESSDPSQSIVDAPISLSTMIALGFFDESGMLFSEQKQANVSLNLSPLMTNVLKTKPFGAFSDVQTLALGGLLHGVYTHLRAKLATHKGTLEADLKAEVSRNPNSEHRELYDSLLSLDDMPEEIQRYFFQNFSFSTDHVFSLKPSLRSKILLEGGWSSIAELSPKVVIALPSGKEDQLGYVSLTQWGRTLTISEDPINIINLEPVDFAYGGGVNYFLPDQYGNVPLPKVLSSLTATSVLIDVIDRIHVYQVDFSSNKRVTVSHFPVMADEAIILSDKEHQYLYFQSKSPAVNTLIHGGYGSDILLNLAHSHTQGAVLTIAPDLFNVVLGKKQEEVKAFDFPSPIDLSDDGGQRLVPDYKARLWQESLVEEMDTNEQILDEPAIKRLSALLKRVQHYDIPSVNELNFTGVETHTQLALKLFKSWQKTKEGHLDLDVSWLLSLLIKPVDGPQHGSVISFKQFASTIETKDDFFKLHLTLLGLLTMAGHLPEKMPRIERLADTLNQTAARIETFYWATGSHQKTALDMEKMLATLTTVVDGFEEIVQGFANEGVDKSLNEVRAHLVTCSWLLSNVDSDLLEHYSAIDSILEKGTKATTKISKKAVGMPSWLHLLPPFSDKERAVSKQMPSALTPFIDFFMAPEVITAQEDDEQIMQRVTNAKALLKKGCQQLKQHLSQQVFEKALQEQALIDDDDDMSQMQTLPAYVKWYNSDCFTRELIADGEVFCFYPMMIEKQLVFQKQLLVIKASDLAKEHAYFSSSQRNEQVELPRSQEIPLIKGHHISPYIASLENKTPKLIVLNERIIKNAGSGSINDPLMIEWLSFAKMGGASIVLFYDGIASSKERFQAVYDYLRLNHVPLTGCIDVNDLEADAIEAAITQIFEAHSVETIKQQRLFIDREREESEGVSNVISQHFIRETITVGSVVNHKAHDGLLHRLAYQYDYLLHAANYFTNDAPHGVLTAPFGFKTDGFKGTSLVRLVSIEAFYQKIDAFHASLFHQSTLLQHNAPNSESFDKRWDKTSKALTMAFSRATKNDILNKYYGYISSNFIASFHAALATLIDARWDECSALSSAELNPIFRDMQQLYVTITFISREQREAWFIEQFDEILTAHKRFPVTLEKRAQEKAVLLRSSALHHFMLSAIESRAYLFENAVDIARANDAYLQEYFARMQYELSPALLNIDALSALDDDHVSEIYLALMTTFSLLGHYLQAGNDIENGADLEHFKELLAVSSKVLFSSENGGKRLSDDAILKQIVSKSRKAIAAIKNNDVKLVLEKWATKQILVSALERDHHFSMQLLGLMRIEVSFGDMSELAEGYSLFTKEMLAYQRAINGMSLKGLIDKSTLLAKILNKAVLKHQSLADALLSSYCHSWDRSFQNQIALSLYEILEEKLFIVESKFNDCFSENEVTAELLEIKGMLGKFNRVFGRSFNEFRLARLMYLHAQKLNNNRHFEDALNGLLEEEEDQFATLHLRGMSQNALELQLSPLLKNPEEGDMIASMVQQNHMQFNEAFRNRIFQQLATKAKRYFPKCKKAIEALDADNTVESLVSLIYIGVESKAKQADKFSNCSNIAFLLNDLSRMNTLESSISGKSLPKYNDKLVALHQQVCRLFLEQRREFLSNPATQNKLGFNFFTSFWSSSQSSVMRQCDSLSCFLDDPARNKNYVAFRAKLLIESRDIYKTLSKRGQSIYGKILTDTQQVDDELLASLSKVGARL